MENISEHKDAFKIEQIDDNPELTALMQTNVKGILCVPESATRQSLHNVLMSETYDFAKWLKKSRKDVAIDVVESEGIKSLRSGDLWFPIVVLASDMSVQVFLGLVSNYIYDRIKGALKHDRTDVHVQIYYKENPEGVLKKFTYNGSVEGFEKVAKRFDINKFLG